MTPLDAVCELVFKFYEVRGYMPGRTVVFDPRPDGYKLVAGEYSKTVPRMTTKQLNARRKRKGDQQTKSRRKSRPEPRWTVSFGASAQRIE